MAWLESHEELESHPKVIDLESRMSWDRDQTIGKLHRFWWWCLKYAPTGDLRKFNDEQLAGGVALNAAQAKQFVEAMVASRWIDEHRQAVGFTSISSLRHREKNRRGSGNRRAAMRGVLSTLTKEEWAAIKDYFCGRCAYCLRECPSPVVEHMTPVSKGGSHSVDNVVPSCAACNSRKYTKTLLEFVGNLSFGGAR